LKIKLNWQRKAIMIFAGIIILLSIILTIFAIREAEREKLIREREIEEQQEGSAELIIDQVKAFISEAEGRIIRLVQGYQIQDQGKALAEVCRRIAEGEEIITEIFLINQKGEVIFPLIKPLFLLPGEVAEIKERAIKIEPNPLLRTAETSEFKTKNYPLAIKSYQELLAGTSDKDHQATLLNCIGRCYEKSGKHLKAIETYRKILSEHENELSADAIPLGIIAQYEIGEIFAKTNRKIKGVEAFFELYNGLLESKWLLSKNQFHFYQNKVKAMLETSIADINEIGKRKSLMKKWEELQQLEEEKLKRMDSKENLLRKVIPLIKTKKHVSSEGPERFYYLSSTIGEEFYLVSYTPLPENSVFGIRINYEVLAKKLQPLKLETLPLSKDWHVQIKDEFGNTVAGEDITHLKEPIPQLSYSRGFEENFPPWKVNIYESNPGLAERQFKTRRNIYILSVVIVISALLFGGFLAIRSTARELELAKLKSEFVSTVSHEFRTPLTSIRYLAELLKRGRVKEEDKRQIYYETITDESGRLTRLIENILDFSKIEAGMKEYQFRKTDIAELARDVASRFQEQAAPKGFAIESEISNQMPKILADSEALSRALFNLLDNAFKYSGKSLKIFLRARSEGEYVFLEVEDEGIGISREEQKNVFDKFYRSGNVDESSIKGSGIGLTLVAHIVKAHGGEVLLESEVSRGTRVTIKLPLRRKKDENG
jgi:signal transduction histidine kinase